MTAETPATVDTAREIADDLIALRRRIHEQPELGLDLPVTQQAILDALADIDLEITLGRELSSVVAVLRGRGRLDEPDRVRPVVLLRGDMDALPVTEDLDLPYASQRAGVMHACGHDLHVAGLVGAVRILDRHRDALDGDVVFMFQPGEEGPGGAEIMLREGLLDVAGRRVDAAYAVHVFSSEYPRGTWWGRPGPQMAAADEFVVTVRGRGGHGSAPHRTKNPVPVACEIVLALQSMVTRRYDIFDPLVVTVGKIAGGTKDNIIADTAVLEATVRTFSPESRERVLADVVRVAEGIASAHDMTAVVEVLEGYPATVNDPDEFALAKASAIELFGADRWVDMPFPEAGAEDMSFVLNEVPGAYLNLAAARTSDPAAALASPDNHSARADFDDAVVPDAAALLAELALRRCRV